MENRKTLWNNRRWAIDYFEVNGIPRLMVYTVSEHLPHFIDYPVQYDNGTIAYDNPYPIPNYVKNKVRTLFNKIKEEA